ncbi:MAG TPA: YceI family protein [Bacteroidia bacterium]|nr:YceI family protein [Bacteroidia bacterium]
MKKFTFFLAAMLAFAFTAGAQIYKGIKNEVSFYSDAPLEDITAKDTIATLILNGKSGTVIADIRIKGFVFPNPLMQEHFNENYMESDKFPKGSFMGKINEPVDYTKDGTYTVSVTGTLTIHGVAQQRTLSNIKLVVKGNTVNVDFKFDVKLADHKITVPSAVGQKIAEVISVTVHSEMIADAPKK